jgi:hypothetical protein
MAYRLFGCAVVLALAAQTVCGSAAELKVLTTPALTEVWHELAPKFEATGHKLTSSIAVGRGRQARNRRRERRSAGLTPAGIDGLIKSGKVDRRHQHLDASSGMGVAVLKGAHEAGHLDAGRRSSERCSPRRRSPTPIRRVAVRAAAHGEGVERLGIAAEVNAQREAWSGVPAGIF